MTDNTESRSRAYQAAVTVAGVSLWLAAAAIFFLNHTWRDQSVLLLALVPLVVVLSLFPHIFPMPSGLKFTHEKMTFNLSDALLLLVACWYGVAAAVFVGGIEGFTSSRRAVRRLSSNLFSLGMLSLAAGAAAAGLDAVLRFGFGGRSAGGGHNFTAVAVALLVAGLLHIAVNTGLLSALLALRHGKSLHAAWKELLWAAPMFLPASAAATLMYLALRQGVWPAVVISAPVLVAVYLVHRQLGNSVQERISLIEKSNRERIASIEKAHRQTIEALAVAINAKDEVTHEHVLRVQIYAAGVARLLGCTEAEVEALRAGALLHDIGKIAVPDYILNKPGKLTAAEFDKMKLHTIAGAQILSRVEFPYPVVPVVRHHHERWDGKGYPDALKGEQIPLTARILSVVDCFDAVREDRQYRKAMTREEAITYIMEGSGSFYDPRVVGIFITHLPEFEAEIQAHRDDPIPTYGIEPMEQLSEAALEVAPAAGLAEEKSADDSAGAGFGADEEHALGHLSAELGACAAADDALAVFVERLGAIIPFDTCAVTRVAPQSGQSVTISAAGRHAQLLKGRIVKTDEGVTGWVLANRKPFCNADPRLDLHPHLADRFAGYRTLAAVPVEADGELYGALTLYSAALTEYTPAQQRLLQRAADILATVFTPPGAAPRPQPALPVVPPSPPAAPLESELTH